MIKILVVDDEKSVRFALSELFKNENFTVISTESAEGALKILEDETIDIAVLDYNLPGINGIDLLGIIKENFSWIQVILITAFGSEEVAIEAIKKGAYDYIAKPFNNFELLNRVNHIRDSILNKKESKETQYGYYFSKSMQSIIEKVKSVAKTDIPVLITGESGTGKELIAKLFHFHSKREGNFVSVNSSALPPSLIESELFGSEKGAYTGSTGRKKGLFELADNGTIFLDEIGEMPYEMQAKLLRVLEENEIIRIGGGLPVKINARVIAATNRNIDEEIGNKNFREDLFYRLNVIPIKIPALRTRKDEIKPLSLMFLNDFNKKYDKGLLGFEEILLDRMQKFDWPGNIRELKNKIEKAVILSTGEWINQQDIQFEGSNIIQAYSLKNDESGMVDNRNDSGAQLSGFNLSDYPVNLVEAKRKFSEHFEKEFILYYLNKNDWNVRQTAEVIGLCRQDLYKKMKKVGIKKNVNYS